VTATASMPRGRGREGRLVHGYLHKTSNSLCGIKGYASLIAAEGPEARVAAWARKILDEVAQMELIYRSVQEIAFPRPPAAGGGDLDGAVHAAVAAARRRHPRLRVTVALEPAGRLLLPRRDLQLALEEILANSAEAATDGAAAVTVATARGGPRRIALHVTDDGPGLAPGLVAEAATPFVTTKPGHLGIGLSRVDTLMEMHELPWLLESGPAGGARVVLEVAVEPDGAAVARRAAAAGSGKETHV
jgi:C4-dicarboxylate-specific signal transduction histidine kinase